MMREGVARERAREQTKKRGDVGREIDTLCLFFTHRAASASLQSYRAPLPFPLPLLSETISVVYGVFRRPTHILKIKCAREFDVCNFHGATLVCRN